MNKALFGFNHELINEIREKFPFKLDDMSNRIKLTFNNIKDQNSFDNLMIDVKMIEKYYNTKYWLELLEYEMKCFNDCIVYVNAYQYEDRNKPKEERIKWIAKDILKQHDFYMFIDMAYLKFYTAIEKIAQLLNSLYILGLNDVGFGRDSVSIINVMNKLKVNGYHEFDLVLTGINDIVNSNDMKKFRNAFTHHHHPLHQKNIMKVNIEGEKIEITETIYCYENELFKDESIMNLFWALSLIENAYNVLQEKIKEMHQIITKYFEIG